MSVGDLKFKLLLDFKLEEQGRLSEVVF
jgi:hypothetical protein